MPSIEITSDQAAALARGESITLAPSTPLKIAFAAPLVHSQTISRKIDAQLSLQP